MAKPASSGASGQLPNRSKSLLIPQNIQSRFTRRQWTLIAITVLLNILFYSSLFCAFVAIYLLASDSNDGTNVASEALTLGSALLSLAYINLHSIFCLKQRIWRHQRRHPSVDKNASYIAIRFAVTLCILWLLTAGWNMIVVARRPVCLPKALSLSIWEAGRTCQVARSGMAFGIIALVASGLLFSMLSTVSRPFEAHLLNYSYTLATTPDTTPNASHRSSPSRTVSVASHAYRGGRLSHSTHRSNLTCQSNTDVDTLDLNATSPPQTIVAPAPIRSLGLGIFTSDAHPPPFPPSFTSQSRASSLDLPPPLFHQPSLSSPHLPLPPRLVATAAGTVPISVAAQYSASAWRAVHPNAPLPGSSVHPQHPAFAGANQNMPYRIRYCRSSVSLTRPRRLSTATPVSYLGWGTCSDSTAPSDGRGTPSSSRSDAERRATASEIAYAILNGTNIPGTDMDKTNTGKYPRRMSAPDASARDQQQRAMSGWQPELKDQSEPEKPLATVFRPSSIEILSKLSLEDKTVGKETGTRSSIDRYARFRKVRSEDPIRVTNNPESSAVVVRSSTTNNLISQMPSAMESGIIAGTPSSVQKRRMTLEEAKNKPLPRIAAL